jgi:acyl-CoA thioester hydrolase
MSHSQFTITRRVQFAETDLAGIVHFSNFFRYMEEVEHAFYRSLGYSVHAMPGETEGSTVGWPRVHAEADYRRPLRFEDEFEMELLIEEVRSKTIAYRIHFWNKDAAGERELAAHGKLVVVCVAFDKAERKGMRAVNIPSHFRDKISAASEDQLQIS